MEANTNQEVAIETTYHNLVLKKMIMKEGLEVVLKRILGGEERHIRFIDSQNIEDIGKSK